MAEMKDMAEVKDIEQEPNIWMFDCMAHYQEAIHKLREAGATKKSYDRTRQEYHQYMQMYPIPSLAVSLCLKAFDDTVAEKLTDKAKPETVKEQGRIAYCGMLPKLVNRESIRDFIACVVHGMALNIIPGPDGARLLYGAQVAQAALPAKRKWRKDPAKIKPEAAPECTQTAPKQPSNFTEPSKKSAS